MIMNLFSAALVACLCARNSHAAEAAASAEDNLRKAKATCDSAAAPGGSSEIAYKNGRKAICGVLSVLEKELAERGARKAPKDELSELRRFREIIAEEIALGKMAAVGDAQAFCRRRSGAPKDVVLKELGEVYARIREACEGLESEQETVRRGSRTIIWYDNLGAVQVSAQLITDYEREIRALELAQKIRSKGYPIAAKDDEFQAQMLAVMPDSRSRRIRLVRGAQAHGFQVLSRGEDGMPYSLLLSVKPKTPGAEDAYIFQALLNGTLMQGWRIGRKNAPDGKPAAPLTTPEPLDAAARDVKELYERELSLWLLDDLKQAQWKKEA
jgi:hypothetical protein